MTENNKFETIVVKDEKDEDSDCEIVEAIPGQVDIPDYIDPKSLTSILEEPTETLPPVIENIVSKLSNDEEFDKECDKFYKANLEMDVENVQVDVVNVLSSAQRLNKASKTSAERGREFRARMALLKQQSKEQQELDDIVQSVSPSEDKQIPGLSELRTMEKRAKSAEATRRWREKKLFSASSKKQAKTAAQRMREYRKRKKFYRTPRQVKTISLSADIDDIRTTTDLPGICSLCKDSGDHVQLLLIHLRDEHQLKEGLFICPFCDYTSVKYEVVMKHTTKVHKLVSEQHKCEQCDYKTFRGDLYNRHLNQHLKEKIYSCDHCNYKTINVVNFKRHLASKHTKETAYKCHSCNFTSTNLSMVKRHETARHASPKVYSCNKCSYKTTFNQTLIRHQKRYCKNRSKDSEVFTYVCIHCNFKAEDLSALEDHTLIAHPKKEILFCNICEFSTTESAELKKHAQTHLKNEPTVSEN